MPVVSIFCAVVTLEAGRQAPNRRRSRKKGPLLGGALAVVLIGAAVLVLEPLAHALPAPTAELTLPTAVTVPGKAPVLPWPKTGEAAVAVDGLGTVGTFGKGKAVPIASVTKVMTAYMILTEHPLKSDEPGPSLKVSAQQAATYAQEYARGESLVAVKAGAEFTEREALEAVMLPSANNMARILAAWDAGSVKAFVAKMNDTAAKLGMSNTHYTDPAGYDPGTVSTAADQVILGRKAMAIPAFAEIAAEKKATLPVAGKVDNYNSLLGMDGIVGIKTGSTDQAGGCLMFAAVVTVGDTKLTIVGAILGQPGAQTTEQLREVFKVTRPVVRKVAAALAVRTIVRAGEQVAAVHGPLDTGTTLLAGTDLNMIGWPGMKVQLSADLPAVPAELPAGAEHGRLTASGADGLQVDATLRTGAPLKAPSTWSRLIHHQ